MRKTRVHKTNMHLTSTEQSKTGEQWEDMLGSQNAAISGSAVQLILKDSACTVPIIFATKQRLYGAQDGRLAKLAQSR